MPCNPPAPQKQLQKRKGVYHLTDWYILIPQSFPNVPTRFRSPDRSFHLRGIPKKHPLGENLILTSPIRSLKGAVAHTRSGSCYHLEIPDTEFIKWLETIRRERNKAEMPDYSFASEVTGYDFQRAVFENLSEGFETNASDPDFSDMTFFRFRNKKRRKADNSPGFGERPWKFRKP